MGTSAKPQQAPRPASLSVAAAGSESVVARVRARPAESNLNASANLDKHSRDALNIVYF